MLRAREAAAPRGLQPHNAEFQLQVLQRQRRVERRRAGGRAAMKVHGRLLHCAVGPGPCSRRCCGQAVRDAHPHVPAHLAQAGHWELAKAILHRRSAQRRKRCSDVRAGLLQPAVAVL